MLPGDLAHSKLMQSLEQTQPQSFMSLAPGEVLSLCGQVHMGPDCLCCYRASGSLPARCLSSAEGPCGGVDEAVWKNAHLHSLFQAYLESFYKFCKTLGGTTADAMCPILEVGLETPIAGWYYGDGHHSLLRPSLSASVKHSPDSLQHPHAHLTCSLGDLGNTACI